MTRCRSTASLSVAALTVLAACLLAALAAMWWLVPAARAADAERIPGLGPLPAGRPVSVIAVVWGKRGNKLALLTPDGRRGAVVADGRKSTLCDLVWSPDGRYLAYTLQRYPGALSRGRLFVYDATTGASARFDPGVVSQAVRGYTWISSTELVVATFRHRPEYRMNGFLVRYDMRDRTCRPLADGSRVAFLTCGPWSAALRPYPGAVCENVRVLSTASGAVWTVASLTAPSSEPAGVTAVKVSPDGRYLLVIQSANDVGFTPLIYAATDGRPVRQTWDQMYGGAAWDPTGPAHLVIAGVHGIDTPPFSGTLAWSAGDRRIHPGMTVTGYATGPAWSPDGDRLAYTVVPRGRSWPAYRGSLWVATADGARRHLVARQATSPDWAVTTLRD